MKVAAAGLVTVAGVQSRHKTQIKRSSFVTAAVSQTDCPHNMKNPEYDPWHRPSTSATFTLWLNHQFRCCIWKDTIMEQQNTSGPSKQFFTAWSFYGLTVGKPKLVCQRNLQHESTRIPVRQKSAETLAVTRVRRNRFIQKRERSPSRIL